MDLLLGPVDHQPSPPPLPARLAQLDVASLIAEAAKRHPERDADQLRQLIGRWGVPVSGIWTARAVQRRRRMRGPQAA